MKTPLLPAQDVRLNPKGILAERIEAALRQWVIPTPYSNPLMLEQLRYRERRPQLLLQAWHGEFPGKHLTGAVALYAMTRDAELRRTIEYMVDQLARCQDEDGYLGAWPREERMVGRMNPAVLLNAPHWDVWSHYHIMLGLYRWYKLSDCEKAWTICQKAAECVCAFFLDGGRTVDECQMNETSSAIGHIFALLYEETRSPRYLEMAMASLKAQEAEICGDHYRAGLAGVPFHQTRKPRWESLHGIQQLVELYRITGEESYRKAFLNLCRSMIVDRHATGGFTSGEMAKGSPYCMEPIETCCTVAWLALLTDLIHLTHDSRVADELELSTFNGMLGAQHPSGRYFVYNAPMVGEKRSSTQDIAFQAAAGGPELSCCSVNGARGVGLVGQWGAMPVGDRLYLNWYGASEITATLAGGTLRLEVCTAYPLEGRITLRIVEAPRGAITLALRIPGWSKRTMLLHRDAVITAVPGTYAEITAAFAPGEEIALELDMTTHVWVGEEDAAGRNAWYRGPLLLAYDARFNAAPIAEVPALVPTAALTPVPNEDPLWPAPWLLVRVPTAEGGSVLLCDYASAGATGLSFTVWLPGDMPLPPLPAADGRIWTRNI